MKNNSKFKKSRIVVPALALAVLTTTAAATSTVAWFAANSVATATGMNFTAKSGSNLLIAKAKLNTTTNLDDNQFGPSISQSKENAVLHPASTVDAEHFFYTESSTADGKAITGDSTYTAIPSADVNSPSDTYAYSYYLDYVFELKAVSTVAAQNIFVTQLDLKYNNAYPTGELASAAIAFRAAIFLVGAEESGVAYKDWSTLSAPIGTPKIFTPVGAENQTSGKAVNSATTTDTVTYVSSNADTSSLGLVSSDIDAGVTKYFKGVCRVWLEGEDKKCTNDLFKTATKKWTVDLGFTLGTATATTSAVKNIKIA